MCYIKSPKILNDLSIFSIFYFQTRRHNKQVELQFLSEGNMTVNIDGKKLVEIGSDIGMMVKVFTNGPGDLGSIPCRVIPKTQKMVLDVSLLNTQHYKVRIKGKVEQSWERSSALPYTLV